jgi:hypothetical protein
MQQKLIMQENNAPYIMPFNPRSVIGVGWCKNTEPHVISLAQIKFSWRFPLCLITDRDAMERQKIELGNIQTLITILMETIGLDPYYYFGKTFEYLAYFGMSSSRFFQGK